MSELSPEERAALDECTKPLSAGDGSYMESVWIAGMNYAFERAAEKLKISASEIRLMAGELTAGEMRTAQAVLHNRATHIRNLKKTP